MLFIFYVVSIVFYTAFCVFIFVVISCGSLSNLQKFEFGKQSSSKTEHSTKNNAVYPYITEFGEAVTDARDLDAKITDLSIALATKQSQIDNCRIEHQAVLTYHKKLEESKNKCVKSNIDVVRAEYECTEIAKRLCELKKFKKNVSKDGDKEVVGEEKAAMKKGV